MFRLKVADHCVAPDVASALQDLGFLSMAGAWLKISLATVSSATDLRAALRNLPLTPHISDTIDRGIQAYLASPHPDAAANIEKALWPAKLSDDILPSFIVPIQSQWAQHFFDSDLGSELLIGLREELHLGIEGAYFCSQRNTMLKAPARVLWYVSRGSENRGSMSIKACSRIEEVVIGRPKELYREYKRLGVYQWRDVFAAAGSDINQELLAFRFSLTERFCKPIDRSELDRMNVRSPIMSPRRISAEQFFHIYRKGKSLP